MAFTSLEFLFLFFPLAWGGYYFANEKLKNLFLLAASILFYTLGEPKLFGVLVISIFVNWVFGLLLGNDSVSSRWKKVLLLLSLLWNFGLLFYYKYLEFSVYTLNRFLGIEIHLPMDIQMPLGLSFFTFRTVSYCLDVYWGSAPAQKSLVDAALYVSFFPQLVMGPIVKYDDFVAQLKNRQFSPKLFLGGAERIIAGLFKKLVIADTIAPIVDAIFAMGDAERTVALAWLGIVGYLIQLYYDFSGYSDIAIGLGALFGFTTPENFNYPYLARSASEFWNRWHITLGMWLQSYLYLPIARTCISKGMRRETADILAVLGVWLFAGIWHGAGWTYIFFGLYYFVFIAFERIVEYRKKARRKKSGIKEKQETRMQKILPHFYFITVLIFGQLLFRSSSISGFGHYFACLFGLRGNAFSNAETLFYLKQSILVLLVGIVFCFPVIPWIHDKLQGRYGQILIQVLTPVLYGLGLIVALAFAFTGSYQAFVYFQF